MHAHLEVKTVSVETLDARIKVELLTALLFCIGSQPIEEPGAITGGTGFFAGNQVIDIHELTASEHLTNSETGQRFHFALVFQEGQLVAGALHSFDAGEEIFGFEVCSQLQHHRKTAAYVLVGFG